MKSWLLSEATGRDGHSKLRVKSRVSVLPPGVSSLAGITCSSGCGAEGSGRVGSVLSYAPDVDFLTCGVDIVSGLSFLV